MAIVHAQSLAGKSLPRRRPCSRRGCGVPASSSMAMEKTAMAAWAWALDAFHWSQDVVDGVTWVEGPARPSLRSSDA